MFRLSRLVLSAALCSLLISACREPMKAKDGTVFKTAADYNDYIIARQTKVVQHIIDMGNKAETSPDTAYAYLDSYARQTDTIIDEINGMPPFKQDSMFRNAAVNSFRFYRKLFAESYRRILQIRRDGRETTEEGFNEIVAITDTIRREEEKLDRALHNAQSVFAGKYKMKMRPNEIQKEIDKQKD